MAVAVPQNWGLVFVLQDFTTETGQVIAGGITSIVCTEVEQVLILHQSVTVSVTGNKPQPVTTLGDTLMEKSGNCPSSHHQSVLA